MKNLVIILFVFLVTSCGFQPLYAKKQGGSSVLVGNSFEVKKISGGRAGQKLQYGLEDLFNHGASGEKKYRIETKLEKLKEGVGLQKNRFITRYNLRMIANYNVFDIATGKKIFSGSNIAVGGYNAVSSEYGTYALEENTELSLMDELAKEIVLSVATKLSNNPVEKLVAEQSKKKSKLLKTRKNSRTII